MNLIQKSWVSLQSIFKISPELPAGSCPVCRGRNAIPEIQLNTLSRFYGYVEHLSWLLTEQYRNQPTFPGYLQLVESEARKYIQDWICEGNYMPYPYLIEATASPFDPGNIKLNVIVTIQPEGM